MASRNKSPLDDEPPIGAQKDRVYDLAQYLIRQRQSRHRTVRTRRFFQLTGTPSCRTSTSNFERFAKTFSQGSLLYGTAPAMILVDDFVHPAFHFQPPNADSCQENCNSPRACQVSFTGWACTGNVHQSKASLNPELAARRLYGLGNRLGRPGRGAQTKIGIPREWQLLEQADWRQGKLVVFPPNRFS